MADGLLISLTQRFIRLCVVRRQRVGLGLLGTSAEQIANVDVEVPSSTSELRAAVDDGISRLASLGWVPPTRLNVEAQLGLRYAVVGLLRVERAAGLPFRQQAAYVRAWASDRLHLDPDSQVMRWQVLSDGEGVLISCVDRAVHETLGDFCKLNGMHFASCIPAIMLAVRSANKRVDRILTWTEGGEGIRDGSIHMLAFKRGTPVASWRAWLSPHAGDFANDIELAGAERRFQSFAGWPSDSTADRMHWPMAFDLR